MSRPISFLDRLADRRMRRLWAETAGAAEEMELDDLRDVRAEARRMRRSLDELLHVADGRLALPLLGSNAMTRPSGADWVWRPEAWRGPVEPSGLAGVEPRTRFGSELAVHHDCPMGEVTFRQLRNARQGDLAPFGVSLDVLGFAGSYLSLAFDLPDEAVENLARRHIVRVEMSVDRERDITLYARLNVKNGPNTEQVVAKVEGPDHAQAADFDLGFTKINEARVERVWFNLFFEEPAMSRVVIRDLVMSRRFRAEV